jgi:predicted NACHT family NTPase
MAKRAYNWQRFWCPLEVTYNLDDDGFLVEPEGEYAEYFQPRVVSFKTLAKVPCLALLGEPGMGKSTAVEDAYAAARAAVESSGDQALKIDLKEYDSGAQIVRDIFESDVYRNWLAGETVLELFIDSLDECLLRVTSVANLLAGQLRRRKPPKDRFRLRIACRTAEWPHSLGKAMEEIWEGDSVGIYQLMPLRKADVITAAAVETDDAGTFLRAVRDRRVGPLASKPITLEFLLQTYKEHRDLPKTQAELYRAGCRFLVTETAPSRKEAGLTGRLSADERFAIAGRIAAVTVLCNRPSVWVGDAGQVPKSDVTVPELMGAFNEVANGLEIRVDEAAVREVLATTSCQAPFSACSR